MSVEPCPECKHLCHPGYPPYRHYEGCSLISPDCYHDGTFKPHNFIPMDLVPSWCEICRGKEHGHEVIEEEHETPTSGDG